MRRFAPVLFVLPFVALFGADPTNTNRPQQWKQVEEAVKKGLPKTAIEHIDPIIRSAVDDKAYAEAIKAIGRKIALEGAIQGNKPEEKITRMQAAIAQAPAEMKPVMDVILANWYWHYYQQNRWRFLQRTQTSEAPGDDFTTWDLTRIFAEIDAQLDKAFAASAVLKKTPIADYDALLIKGNMSDAHRPTLYDFLAHDALLFYTSGEQAGAKPEDAFELSAEGPIFASAAEFVQWNPDTEDADAAVYKAVRIYQELLKFHADDDDRTAWLDADLARLVFGNNKAFGEEKNARYQAALKRWSTTHAEHTISSRAMFHWASALHGDGELVEAHRVATEGKNRNPESLGGRQCHNLLEQIEARNVQIDTERVWNKPLPTINVSYKNLTKVFFRVYTYDWEARLNGGQPPEYFDRKQQIAALAKKPLQTWSADLPATEDYQMRTETLPAPEGLDPGSYLIFASHDESFRANNNFVTYGAFWVSDLALVVRTRHGDGVTEGFVLDAISGEPKSGAKVRSWSRNRNRFVAAGSTRTDNNGLFRFESGNRNQIILLAEHQGEKLGTANSHYSYVHDTTPKPYSRTVFFTDRSLYRPGQTVQYKGLCIQVDQQKDDYKTIAKESVTVVFSDPNGKEIARQQHRANDYGSFNGSFTTPRDRLMGRMSIRVDGQPQGAAAFNVEEYKRPKFQVTVDAPKEAARLGAAANLTGKATAYTGAAIDGAKVRWRVVREVRYPIWWHWRCWWAPPQQESAEIAHGTATSSNDGSFEIEFLAKPDPTVLEEDEPTFQYTVYADVTDTAGETRSAERVIKVGYTALAATLSADDWQTNDTAVDIKISTTTLDGEAQAAKGTVKIYRVRQPKKVQRSSLAAQPYPRFNQRRGGKAPPPDPTNINSWPLGDVVAERDFATDATGSVQHEFPLKEGVYRVKLATQDRFGKPVTAELPLKVLQPSAKKLSIRVPNLVAAPNWSAEPGKEFQALWGSGYGEARAFVEIEHRRKLVQSYWTKAGQTQTLIKQAVDEAMRGGFTVRVTMVRENRAYLSSHRVDVPWSNKDLTIKWEHFVSKLEPAQKETWTAIITGPDAKKTVAEMVAGLYDASLDAYLPHAWQQHFGVFRQDHSNLASQFENTMRRFQYVRGQWPSRYKDVTMTYRAFPYEVIGNFWGYQFPGKPGDPGGGGFPPPSPLPSFQQGGGRRMANAKFAEMAMDADGDAAGGEAQDANGARGNDRLRASDKKSGAGKGNGGDSPDLSKVAARKNLNETAFFFPHLISDKDGQVKIEFSMPEALTEWKFMGFAHDNDLRAGFLQDTVVTAKDLMVQPNPPRFVREGDTIEFSVKVSNQSAAAQNGKLRLTLADARTGKSVDAELNNASTDLAFEIPSKESRSFSWRLSVPDGLGFLTYKTVGSTGRLSDGEEGFLPVLSRRILVTESLPLPIRGPKTRQFDFTRLGKSGDSDTLRHESLTVQMVSNPSWYAVMALPYLMEYPHQCNEQVFNRLYANALARHIAVGDPKIRRIFDAWKNTPSDTLDSPLTKNQDLKAVMLEETPWLRQANKESEARRNVGILFDDNRLDVETRRALLQLSEAQRGDGAWSWFPGGPANEYITLYITTGFGRMRHLGVEIDTAPAVKSLAYLDGWIDRIYRDIKKKDEYHLSPTIALYLYGRSFFLKDKPIDAKHREAVDYFQAQARKYWLRMANRQSQAHLAVALKRFGDGEVPQAIMKSIKERSVSDEELGTFWRDTEHSWWWYRAPIETQAMMIEAFDEVMNDAAAVENCKVWLLKQKQTQDWKTTKATADAVYALLLRGSNLLASDALVEVSLGGAMIDPENVEAGTGFYQHRFDRQQIKPSLAKIKVRKTDEGVAWGSVHWQYLEDMSKITPYDGTPLTLKKALYVKEHSPKGPILKPVTGPLAVGDELVVRVELRTDRSMEYVHLKDQRGSGTEPVNVLSKYKFQDGMYYYESTRDTASHFFIDYLPKGVYVFEYSVRVQHRGEYQTGMAQIQCMYAPEFNSHSESFLLKVK